MADTNKTIPTTADVADFLATLDDIEQQKDSKTLIEMMQEISAEPPVMWGPSIIGFGTYHYVYASGREGDMPLIAFSPRKGKLTLYVMEDASKHEDIRDRLGKHKVSKACIYINKLTDVDMNVLHELIAVSYQDAIKMKTGV